MKLLLTTCAVALLVGYAYYYFISSEKPEAIIVGSEPLRIKKPFRTGGFILCSDWEAGQMPQDEFRLFLLNNSDEPLKSIELRGRGFADPVVIPSTKSAIAYSGSAEAFTCIVLTADMKEEDLNFSVWVESTDNAPIKLRITPLPRPFF